MICLSFDCVVLISPFDGIILAKNLDALTLNLCLVVCPGDSSQVGVGEVNELFPKRREDLFFGALWLFVPSKELRLGSLRALPLRLKNSGIFHAARKE